MILGAARLDSCLAIAREVGRSERLYDVHVSPYEVIFDAFEYKADAEQPGVLDLADDRYHPPTVGPLRLAVDAPTPAGSPPSTLSQLMYRKAYGHVGPRVLADHMALAGISTSLLVPVVRAGGNAGDQFRLMFDLYPEGDRFAFAYCPPASVPVDELADDIAGVVARYPLAALKVHPNLQQIDLASAAGALRIEAVLAAAARHRLPVMIHGGRSTVVAGGGGRAYATLEHLGRITWSAARAPILLGHAGLFGYSHAEASALLPELERLLAANPDMLVDISGLGFETLRAVLRAVDHDRIVFGSDALYFPQWGAVATLVYALETLGLAPASGLARLAGTNPARLLGGEA